MYDRVAASRPATRAASLMLLTTLKIARNVAESSAKGLPPPAARNSTARIACMISCASNLSNAFRGVEPVESTEPTPPGVAILAKELVVVTSALAKSK